jgi:membrane associated rhomboid family serine protease
MIPLRDSQPSSSTPFATIGLIAINVLVFLFQNSLEPYSQNFFVEQYALIPREFHSSAVFTSMFLHGGWMHLIGNMWFLWIFGDNVEDILGAGKYLVFYLLSGAGAAMAQYVMNPESLIPMVGASGAIAGVMGAYLVKFPHSRIVTLLPLFVFFTTTEIPAYLMMLLWFGMQFFSGLSSLGAGVDKGGVAWFAHVGGFLVGVALIMIMRPREPLRLRADLRW